MTEEERRKYIEALDRWNEEHNGDGETERVDGHTPNGGDYSIAYYYDKENRPCKKAVAYLVNIVEYKGDGEYVNSTTAFLQKKLKSRKLNYNVFAPTNTSLE